MSEPAAHATRAQAGRWLHGLAVSVPAARAWLAGAVALGLAGGVLIILQAGLLAGILQRAVMEGVSREALLPGFAGLAAVIALRALAAAGREATAARASAAVRAVVRARLLERVHTLGPAWTAQRRSGGLATTLQEQVEALDGFFARYLPQTVLAVAVPVAILVAVYPVNWAAGTIFLVTAPLIPLFMALAGMGAAWAQRRQFLALARMGGHFLDLLQGLPTLKLLGRARAELGAVERVADAYRRRTMAVLRIAFLSSAVLEFFASVSIAITAVYLGLSYLGYLDFGHYGAGVTLETGLFILLLAPEFYLPLRELGTHYHARAEALGAAEGILEVLEASPPGRVEGRRDLRLAGPPALCLEGVRYAYGDRPALEGLDLTVHPGETVAVVGPSGAGKTTLLNLLLGFLAPQAGRVWVDGVDLAEVDPRAWRRHLAWVGQNPRLFHGTLAENIRLGAEQAGDVALRQAARAAGVDAFARELPAGLDTPVGDRGFGLSGGQIQRVALARAMLRDAPVLLLDEPTASLDLAAEGQVMEALERVSARRTVVMLTHRLENARRADRVVVLEAGRVAEEGAHQVLLARGGRYARMVRGGLPPEWAVAGGARDG